MVKFRTKYDQGDYSDNEVYEPGTSMTEPGQAESMEHLVKRLDKAELVARIARNHEIVGDATKLQDDQIDQLMSDADLDEAETEKTEMAEVVEASMLAQELLAGSGANSARESETALKPDIATAQSNEAQANSQTTEPGTATEPTESPRD